MMGQNWWARAGTGVTPLSARGAGKFWGTGQSVASISSFSCLRPTGFLEGTGRSLANRRSINSKTVPQWCWHAARCARRGNQCKRSYLDFIVLLSTVFFAHARTNPTPPLLASWL